MAGLAAGLLLGAGCSTAHSSHASAPPVTVIRSDSWVAPTVTGPPSTANFCSLLVAMYQHEAQIPQAAGNTVKVRMLQDYIATVPKALAEAPPIIAPAARTYLRSVAQILTDLVQVNLDYHDLKGGSLTTLLLDPAIKSAGNQVLAYSESECHYDIGT